MAAAVSVPILVPGNSKPYPVLEQGSPSWLACRSRTSVEMRAVAAVIKDGQVVDSATLRVAANKR
jgi:hypothetical protein